MASSAPALSPTIHATALLVGARGILIRGPSGSGKSMLAWRLIQRAAQNAPNATFARLIGDDRIHLDASHGRLIARPAPALAGRIEIRGFGILTCPHEPAGVVGLVVDLAAPDAERLPAVDTCRTEIAGISLPRLPVGPGVDTESLVIASLLATAGTAKN